MKRQFSLVLGFFLLAGLSLPSPAFPQDDPDGCLECHSSTAAFQDEEDPGRFVVSPEDFQDSVHEFFGLTCSSCHKEGNFPHSEESGVSCSPCHTDLESRYAESLHGHGLTRGNPRAPNCSSCHGIHDIRSFRDPESPTNRNEVPNVCGGCHGQEGLLTDELVKLPQSFQQYSNSVHGKGITEGQPVAVSCTDCHSVHDLRGAPDPESRINPLNIAATCGRCHPAAKVDYDESIHGRALQAGITDVPTCIDCHDSHLILSADDPSAPICGARQAQETCGKCHDDPVIISKYGLEGGVVGSYLESYHGWASRTGCEVTASCVDCHTAHRILPAEDSTSSISEANVVSTCAQCHPSASPAFASSYNHRTASLANNPVNRIIRSLYLWAILIIVGSMILHNLVIMNFYMIRRRREHAADQGTLSRFTKNEVFQHLFLTVSFILLLITGFALRYPTAWWVETLARIGMTENLRGTTHRVAGVVLILTSLYHAVYVLFTARGRQEIRALALSRRDWSDFLANIRFYTFRAKDKVEFGRYDYSQKAEYWALVWGTILMAVTGLILWFPAQIVRILPGIVIPASQTIHFYEAMLAGLVIFVWHFFFVVFHPEEYPMSWTWLTGKMTRDSAKTHHGEWYEEEMEKEAKSEGPTD